MRVGIIALLHESNTFVDRQTTITDFRHETLLEGDRVRERMASTHHEVGGFFAELERPASQWQNGAKAVPIFAARALPSGTITAGAWSELRHRLFGLLDEAGHLDGVLVAAHGATVSESQPDADGHWLSELRRHVGPDIPIIGTIDPHANLSPLMVASCDALIAYRTNPHLDQHQRGREAARLMVRTLRHEVRPEMRAEFLPLAINIERQMTSEQHMHSVYDLASRQLEVPRLLSNSVVLGFPYADVAEMGAAVIAVADGDLALARQCARTLAEHLWAHRDDYIGQLIDLDDALDECSRLDGPICLLDMGDNVGGGSTGDGTYVAHALALGRLARSFVCLCDPESVRAAEQAGEGRRLELSVGGKTDAQHGSPLTERFRVCSLHDGRFREEKARHGGFAQFDQGATAIVETDYGLTIMLTSRRMVPFSLRQLTSCGLDPSQFHILVAKGVNAPATAYGEVCRHMIRVNSPGSTSADLRKFAFQHRRRPMFPFEPETRWTVAEDT